MTSTMPAKQPEPIDLAADIEALNKKLDEIRRREADALEKAGKQ